MNTREAAEYLRKTHSLEVQPSTIGKWIRGNVIVACKSADGRWEVTEECLDEAIDTHNIPRKIGRRALLTKKQREQIREMFDKKDWTQKQIASRFGISESYVSLIVRGLR